MVYFLFCFCFAACTLLPLLSLFFGWFFLDARHTKFIDCDEIRRACCWSRTCMDRMCSPDITSAYNSPTEKKNNIELFNYRRLFVQIWHYIIIMSPSLSFKSHFDLYTLERCSFSFMFWLIFISIFIALPTKFRCT